MTIYTFVIALFVVYISICFGSWLKLSYYGVRNNKILIAAIGPVVVLVWAQLLAWKYIKEKDKEFGSTLNMLEKLNFLRRLTVLNVQWLPALIGFWAVAIHRAEKNINITEAAKKRQTRRVFTKKSYELYNDFIDYGVSAA